MSDKDNCQHEWKVFKSADTAVPMGYDPAYMKCDKCGMIVTLADVMQMQALEKQTEAINDQRKSGEKMARYQLIALIIAALAIIATLGIFYYRDWTTTRNRKNCFRTALNIGGDNFEKNYAACLRNNGLQE